MNNVFIDVGCFDGDTIKQFCNWKNLITPDNWMIYGFDPNPRFKDIWKKMSDHTIKIEQSAAYTYNGEIEYTLRPLDAPLGSTVMKEKVDWGMGDILKVPCFDFAEFVKQNHGDYTIVKMDAEGAEFPILDHLIEQGADEFIDILLIEWHDTKLPRRKSNKGEILSKLSCEVYQWR